MKESLYLRIGGHEGIARLLKHFYADVRQHRVIGPIFLAKIDNWPEHLLKIGEFWARITGGPSRYAGQMPVKHLELGIGPEHFAAWLGLWEANCRAYLAPVEAEELIELAHDIGRRLSSIISQHSAGTTLKAPLPWPKFAVGGSEESVKP
jgi:hemoglobin